MPPEPDSPPYVNITPDFRGFRRPVTLIFDLFNLKLTFHLLVSWGTYVQVLVFLRFLFASYVPVLDSSANLKRLTVPRCRLSTYGYRASYYAGPAVWNSLPDEILTASIVLNSF